VFEEEEMKIGSPESPLRVAIIGSGPTGFYAAQHLLKTKELHVSVDVFDRLPTPFGLVRFGVAPDHPKIKSVTAVYEKTAKLPGFRFFGNVELGRDISVAGLREHYHQIIYCTGAQTDRRLGIPGEDLPGSHTATEFVAWYNGHPDYVDHKFDLSAETAVVIGVGNVAVDVARILCRTPEELEKTDIADHALQALRRSQVRRVVMVGRRGPAQAAFSNSEAKELGELEDALVVIRKDEAQVDDVTAARLVEKPDKMLQRKLDLIQELATAPAAEKSKRLEIRFLLSPTEAVANVEKSLSAVILERNRLEEQEGGYLASIGTGETENIDAGLLFRSVGYRGVPLPDVPFDERKGTIPHKEGRVLSDAGGSTVVGEYCAGWIKRGPRGVIGTNKADALETVRCMLEDLEAGHTLQPTSAGDEESETWIAQSQPVLFRWPDWERLDALEKQAAESTDRPRIKFVSIEEMHKQLQSS
jgi:ferredoxin--NADP+ reductase